MKINTSKMTIIFLLFFMAMAGGLDAFGYGGFSDFYTQENQFKISQPQAVKLIEKNLDQLVINKNLPLAGMEDIARKALVDDFIDMGVDYIDAFDRDMIEVWKSLSKTKLRKDITWLQRVKEWREFNFNFIQDGDEIKILFGNNKELAVIVKENGSDVLKIADEGYVDDITGSVINKDIDQTIKVTDEDGEIITSAKLIKNSDGSIGFYDADIGNINQATVQILGKKPSSKVLAKNFELSGMPRPPNHAAHHIVAGNESYINAEGFSLK